MHEKFLCPIACMPSRCLLMHVLQDITRLASNLRHASCPPVFTFHRLLGVPRVFFCIDLP